MSEDSEEKTVEVPAAKAARKRPAARKATKPKPTAEEGGGEKLVESLPEQAPVADTRSAGEERSSDAAPEPIPFFVENSSTEPPGNSKKRRRRKKKHGQSQGPHPQAAASSGDIAPSGYAEAPVAPPVMHAVPRPKLDSDQVAKKAWKIFLSEVGEEGLALIDDHDAREISRRCFRLAEIFLEEAAKRNR